MSLEAPPWRLMKMAGAKPPAAYGRERYMKNKFTSMSRRTFLGSMGVASMTLAACGGAGGGTTEAFNGALTGTYDMHVQGYDWGAGVDKIVLNLNAPLDAVDVDSFVVTEHKQSTDWTKEDFPVVEIDAPRTVTAATLGDGNTVELELACSPSDGSPFLYTMATGYNTWSDPYDINITLGEGVELTSGGTAVTSVAIEPVAAKKTTSADAWTTDSYKCADGTTYAYAAFAPEEESKNLVVWLHGAGEGGTEKTDPYVTILANKVVALSEEEFQDTVGGAHVVAPQSPTMWMDIDGNKTYISAENSDEVKSIYTESLEEFIDEYAKKVGAEKIVLAGCSNGGFMTTWMAIDRPDKYVGVVPICEAVPDSLITNAQIKGLVNLPMYFIYSKDDGTVDPKMCEEPTIARLKAAGKTSETLHVATTDHVIDTSGEYTNEDGTPYQYNGHWSWIYFDNNESECDEDGLKAFDFIAECFE